MQIKIRLDTLKECIQTPLQKNQKLWFWVENECNIFFIAATFILRTYKPCYLLMLLDLSGVGQ